MNFFIQIHRSLFDLSFYEEIVLIPGRKIIAFVFQLVAITVCIITICHLLRIVHPEKGLPTLLPLLFSNLEITSEGLITYHDSVYTIDPVYLAECLTLLSNTFIPPQSLPDSFMVVHNRDDIVIEDNSSIHILLSAKMIQVNFAPLLNWRLPYSAFVAQSERIVFTPSKVSTYLKKRGVKLFLNLYLQHFLLFNLKFFISLFFLFFAAYILKTKYISGTKMIIKIVAFAAVPVALASMLIALSGAKNINLWMIALVLSFVMIIRADRYLSTKYSNNPKER